MGRRSFGQFRRRGNQPPATLDEMLGLLTADDRRRLLLRLASEPQDVTSLADQDRDALALVSYRLGNLLQGGLVHVTKEGRRRIYELADCVKIRSRAGRTVIEGTTGEGDLVRITLAA